MFDFCNLGAYMQNADKSARLEEMLIRVQQRWGSHALRQGVGTHVQPPVPVSTTFAGLDAILGGGLPRGQISEFIGRATSGMTTLAYKSIASAQSTSAYALYMDLENTFDPDYALRCGVVLKRLFLARPDTDLDAFDLTREVLVSGGLGIIVLDMGKLPPGDLQLRRLMNALVHTGCVVLVLRQPPVPADSPAAVRLLVQRLGWLQRQADIRGYRVGVTLLKHRRAAGQHVDIEIDFDDTITGEPL